MTQPLTIVGAVGSPYSRKLRAILRYRRLPHAWVNHGAPEAAVLPRPRVELLPQLILDGQALTDTTPLIRELERRHTGRSVVPPDAALAFVDALLEDYADEWLTKCMYHYRWASPPGIAKAAAILPRWFSTVLPEAEALAAGEKFARRQIERRWVVGSNDTTAPVIEDSYVRLLGLLAARLTESRFVMGDRPGTCDFALYGQLTQLAGFDPESAAIALARAPRVAAWVDVVEDLSGLEPADGDWLTRDAVPPSVRALLAEAGRVYVPFLLANAAALESGAERVECEIDGRAWVQQPFPYQGKCLAWLRRDYGALAAADRAAVDELLRGTGCERLFAPRGAS